MRLVAPGAVFCCPRRTLQAAGETSPEFFHGSAVNPRRAGRPLGNGDRRV